MRQDVHELYGVAADRIRVIHNGIDLNQYRPREDSGVLLRHGIDPERPFVLFVGRITRQKGIIHLVRAIKYMERDLQVVLCAGAPDTPEIAREMTEAVERARAEGTHHIVWIEEMLPKEQVITLYTHAAVFVCPSVYEPFGIINLEAMACETPVVASAVGGIPEVVEHGETGLLVVPEAMSAADVEPMHPDRFARDLAAAVNTLMGDDALRERMGRHARRRVEHSFSWSAIAGETRRFYEALIARHREERDLAAGHGTRS
jgi:glycogen synthase